MRSFGKGRRKVQVGFIGLRPGGLDVLPQPGDEELAQLLIGQAQLGVVGLALAVNE